MYRRSTLSFMLVDFVCQNPDFHSSETRDSKDQRATRSSYIDEAAGYVQVKRESGKCFVKAENYTRTSHSFFRVSCRSRCERVERWNDVVSSKCRDCRRL
ncbi:hypothetical protein GE061_018254 [Apolygus lucorum]|uniref:Uncharacterized protein n=1 Tax=Apolygus lucorum TaxID=248454 RepID=A0A8S9XG17_APOLU|nr:hypothetical protein GE061_018254 [Apolygus lucorum]